VARISHDDVRRQSYFLTHNWNITIPTPDFFPDSFFNFYPDTDFLNTRCESSSIPATVVQTIDVFINGRQTKVPGQVVTNSPIQLVFYEDEDHLTSTFFNLWKLGGGSTKTLGHVSRSEAVANNIVTMDLLGSISTDPYYESTQRFYLQGAFPEMADQGQLAPVGDLGRVVVSLSFQDVLTDVAAFQR